MGDEGDYKVGIHGLRHGGSDLDFWTKSNQTVQDPWYKETEVKKSKGPVRRLLRICLDIFLVCGVIGNGRLYRLRSTTAA